MCNSYYYLLLICERAWVFGFCFLFYLTQNYVVALNWHGFDLSVYSCYRGKTKPNNKRNV